MQTTDMPVRRRLSDRIEDAFEQACRQGQADVAACLLKGLDLCLLGQPTPWDRRQTALVLLRACAVRLDALRQAEADRTPEPAYAGFHGRAATSGHGAAATA